MSFGKKSVQGRGSGSRSANAPDEGTARRLPTYAELSQPGPDEVPDEPLPRISNEKAYFLAGLKSDLIIKGGVLAFIVVTYMAGRMFFGGISSGFEEAARGVAREMEQLAEQCRDPAWRARLERDGWTVHVNPDGGCRISRPR